MSSVNNLASVVSSNLYDVFGVLRYAQTPWRWRYVTVAEEGLTTLDGLYVQPKAAITTLGFFTLPGIGIGYSQQLMMTTPQPFLPPEQFANPRSLPQP